MKRSEPAHPPQVVVPQPARHAGSRKAVQLAALLGGAQSVDIVHGTQTYRLQITKAGKLILTK